MLGFGVKPQNLNVNTRRHTTEEIIRILRKADGEQTVEEVCREFDIGEQTFYRCSLFCTKRQRLILQGHPIKHS